MPTAREFWLLTALLLFLPACGPVPQSTNTLVYGRGGDADILDPVLTSSGEAVTVIVNVFDTLVTYHDETLEIVPSLAEKWESSEDGLHWTFHVRPDVEFHDGTPCDAKAIAASLNRMMEESVAYRAHYQMIDSISQEENKRVIIKLSQPSPLFLTNLAMFPASIVSPTALEKDPEGFGRNPIGTGPFKFDSWVPKQKIVLTANEDHWRGRPELDRVVILAVDESAIRVKQISRGEIHIADNLPPSELDSLADVPGVELQSLAGTNVGYLTTQTEKPPLDNVKVRKAIAMSIDKQALCQRVYSGHAIPAKTLVPPTIDAHHDGLEDYPYDPVAAKSLLEEAAAEAGFSLPLELSMFVMQQPRPYMQQPRQTALFIRDSLEKIGIELEITVIDLRQYWARLSRGEHELALAGWTSDNNDPDNFLYSLLDSDSINDQGGNNFSRYDNPELHELLMQGKTMLDKEARRELYLEAQELIHADVPVVPLAHTQVRIAQRKNVEGYKLHPSALVRLRLARLTDNDSAE